MKTWLRRIVSVFVVVLVFLVLSEIILRVTYPTDSIECVDKADGKQSSFIQQEGVLWYYKPKPNLECTFLPTNSRFSTNSHGFIDKEHPYEKEQGTVRIMVLGDSFTQGIGVSYGERFTERMWNSNERVEVINVGVAGYGTVHELLLLQHEGLKYDPDIVILAVFAENDAADNVRPPLEANMAFRLSDDGTLEVWIRNQTITRQASTDQFSLMQLIKSNSYLIRYLEVKLTEISSLRALGIRLGVFKPEPADLANVSADIGYQVKLTRALVGEVVKSSLLNSAKVLLMIIPTREQVLERPPALASTDPDEVRRMLLNFDTNETVRVLDLLPSFREAMSKGVRVYLDADKHFSREGHQLAAALIMESIKDWISRET